jgi:hypothetical protein
VFGFESHLVVVQPGEIAGRQTQTLYLAVADADAGISRRNSKRRRQGGAAIRIGGQSRNAIPPPAFLIS